VVGLAGACSPGIAKTEGPASNGAGDDTKALEAREDEVLRELAAIDRRLAKRARVTPSEEDLRRVTMAGVLREDPTLAVIDGAVDPFSFDARARGLESVRQKVQSLPRSPAGARTSERDLLERLIDEETARIEEERLLPRSASSLVRAIVDTWQPPKSEVELATADRWLARRLGELRAAMTSAIDPAYALDVVRARELDDALDALEHLASAPGFTTATQELVRMREALEGIASRPASKAQSEWDVVARRVRAHLGITASASELSRQLTALSNDLHARADEAVAAAGFDRDALATALEKQVFVSGSCVDGVAGSRVRSMAAPPEREAACHLRHLVARIDDPKVRALALAAMHDHVIVALWALDVAQGAATLAEAQSRHHLYVPVLPDTKARYERIALARPVAALGAAATAHILALGDANALATTWSTIGDVSLDIARRELPAVRPATPHDS
jgi:hypothetical protein